MISGRRCRQWGGGGFRQWEGVVSERRVQEVEVWASGRVCQWEEGASVGDKWSSKRRVVQWEEGEAMGNFLNLFVSPSVGN